MFRNAALLLSAVRNAIDMGKPLNANTLGTLVSCEVRLEESDEENEEDEDELEEAVSNDRDVEAGVDELVEAVADAACELLENMLVEVKGGC